MVVQKSILYINLTPTNQVLHREGNFHEKENLRIPIQNYFGHKNPAHQFSLKHRFSLISALARILPAGQRLREESVPQ